MHSFEQFGNSLPLFVTSGYEAYEQNMASLREEDSDISTSDSSDSESELLGEGMGIPNYQYDPDADTEGDKEAQDVVEQIHEGVEERLQLAVSTWW